jgi:hypothetical protein
MISGLIRIARLAGMLSWIFFASRQSSAEEANIQPAEILTQAEDQYSQGNYENSKRFVDLLASGGIILGTDLRIRYIVLNCRLNSVYENKEQMELWLNKLNEVDRKFEFDPYTDPPYLFSRWKEIRAANNGPSRLNGKSFLGTGLSEDEVKNRSRFWVALMPFGLGHFDASQPRTGALYLSGELLLFYLMSSQSTSYNHKPVSTGAIGFFGLLGAWGYEVNDLMPELMNRDEFRAEELRYYLSLAPFGAGQAKNGEFAKAAAMGAAQTFFIGAASISQNDGAKAVATFGALLSYAYGAYDSWIHHSTFSLDKAKSSKFSLLISPTFEKNTNGESPRISATSPLGLRVGFSWKL